MKWRVQGSAKKNKDYKKISKTLKWKDGEAGEKTFSVDIIDDGKVEGDEAFKLMLCCDPLGNGDTAIVTIVDDEPSNENGTLQFSKETYSFDEDAGTVKIKVSRIGGTKGKVSVKYKASGDATHKKDYTTKPKKLKWKNGEGGNKFIIVKLKDDRKIEDDETFSLTLVKAKGGANIGDSATTEVTIVDND